MTRDMTSTQTRCSPAYDTVRLYGLGDLLREQRRSRPQRVAVVDAHHRFTFAQLDARVNRLVNVLRTHGVGENDRLLWLGQNSFRVMEVLLAAAKLGALLCPANWRMTAAEVTASIEDFQPKVVFWQEAEIGEAYRATRASWMDQHHWIQHDAEAGEPGGYETLLAAASDADADLQIDSEKPVLAIYTAAFDGRPNAALLSHTALLLQGMINVQGQEIHESSAYLVSGPMFHVGVLMGTLATFLAGGRCVFVPRVDAKQLLDLVVAERITHGFLTLPTVEQMRALNRDGAYDVSSLFPTPDMRDWKLPMVMPVTAPLMKTFGGYGQTEIGGLSVLTWMGGSAAGRPAPFLQIMIADEDGKEVPPNQVGEICARGPLVMCGYLHRDEENARRTRHGWHRTNDLGLRKDDGSLVFVGPRTTMIKTGLENVYPAEVEACLKRHPAVADACVIGVPDPTWSQNVKAIVLKRPGHDASEQELIDHCRERIASYKKPKSVSFADSLPRNAMGQIDRAAADALHGGGNYPKVG
ncbi:MAG: acyl-CoA synthetase [Hydrocarboniphaga sp.]|uniref:AMP-binding protein n=1 Tax=Hydrocarboniphaga sp. TaxID=2033016 RepID=UPI00262574AD|nr:AMP-binding protein [Hydrocarboniphaga sp.]MDB5969921.1 acyl-CoA synthetase [Hydrocarboniphaga sp.]